jgi:hypothetical protein
MIIVGRTLSRKRQYQSCTPRSSPTGSGTE